MKTKYALLALVFCLLLTGCKGQSASTAAALKKEIQLKKYSYKAADNQMEHLASASITDSNDIKKVENALNKVIIPKEEWGFTEEYLYDIIIMKEDGNGKWTQNGYSLWKHSEDIYYVQTHAPIDAEKRWWILDVDMELNGVFEKYLK